MWDSTIPVRTDWPGGSIQPSEILYEIDGPTIFVASIGLSNFLFFKTDELEDSDIFIACQISIEELSFLKESRVSLRSAFINRLAWIIQTNSQLEVEKFQERESSSIEGLLPPSGVPLRAKHGNVPDSVAQATALMAFKFTGLSLSSEKMLLSTFKGYVDQISNLVRRALLPRALAAGRNNRFFDVHIAQPVFSSLLLAIHGPEIDEDGLRDHEPTKSLSPDRLRTEALSRGEELWNSIESTAVAAA